jgi:hypothetical protein
VFEQYSADTESLYRQDYAVADTGLALTGDPVEVRASTVYEPLRLQDPPETPDSFESGKSPASEVVDRPVPPASRHSCSRSESRPPATRPLRAGRFVLPTKGADMSTTATQTQLEAAVKNLEAYADEIDASGKTPSGEQLAELKNRMAEVKELKTAVKDEAEARGELADAKRSSRASPAPPSRAEDADRGRLRHADADPGQDLRRAVHRVRGLQGLRRPLRQERTA